MNYPWLAYAICILDYGLSGSSLATCLLSNGGSCDKEYSDAVTVQTCR